MNNLQKKYSVDEYKELIKKITQGKASLGEIKDAEFLIFGAIEEVNSILKTNK